MTSCDLGQDVAVLYHEAQSPAAHSVLVAHRDRGEVHSVLVLQCGGHVHGLVGVLCSQGLQWHQLGG